MTTEVITRADIDRLERIYNLKTVTQDYIHAGTPMGANLTHNGATFRLWAPEANEVYVLVGEQLLNDCRNNQNCQLSTSKQLKRRDDLWYGNWAGFLEEVKEGDQYQFYIKGKATEGLKRDLYARELTVKPDPNIPKWNCIVRDPNSYPWQDQGYHPPAYQDFIIYEMHVGTILGKQSQAEVNTFLDVLDKFNHIRSLGVNAIELLPIEECDSPRSGGYDGTDKFSPEMRYHVEDPNKIPGYLNKVNALLQGAGKQPISADVLKIPINQLKVLVDICHAYGMAVLLDVVYNHIGDAVPEPKNDESIWMYDRKDAHNRQNPNNSPHFTDQKTPWGYPFALWKNEVQQFLIDNAGFFTNEYHIDGFRYDEVSAIYEKNYNDGWRFTQNITDTVRFIKPGVFQIAELWRHSKTDGVKSRSEGGAGFNSCWLDNGLRNALRTEIATAAGGPGSTVSVANIRDHLYPPGFSISWQAVQYIESHDEVHHDDRIAKKAGGDLNLLAVRGRSRVASGILLTSPGVPMLFMGQEIMENRRWSEDPGYHPDDTIFWEESNSGIQGNKQDFLRFMDELVWLRRKHPALRAQEFGEINGYHVNDYDRILAYQRYLKGIGRDVVVVASLREETFNEYWLGFPQSGTWYEVFNSNMYDRESDGAGNGGEIYVDGPAKDGMPASKSIVIPRNSILVFARDHGDF